MVRPKKDQASKEFKARPSPNSLIDPVIRKEFLERRDHWNHLDGEYKKIASKAKTAAKARKQYEQEIGRAGFTMAQISVSLAVTTPEGEAEFKARLANELVAAAYAGAEVGDQLSMFFEPDRTPAIERARREGELAAMEHQAHRPPYDPSVPQYKAWSDGFYAEQERQVLAGVKKKENGDAKAAKGAKAAKKGKDKPTGQTLIPKAEKEAKAAARAAKPPEPPRTVPSAAPVTRSTIKAEKEKAREAAESYFSKSEPAGNA